jgi:DNA polymerase I-like protein with 3'-5' exonuclease and polymerase domains
MKYQPVVFDVETKIVDETPSPHRLGAGVVLWGLRYAIPNGDDPYAAGPGQAITQLSTARITHAAFPARPLIIGHSLTFDIGHLLRGVEDVKAAIAWLLSDDVQLFDTQIAAYLLRGCGLRQPSLERVAQDYGVEFTKDEWVSAAFDKGIGADVLLAEDPERFKRYLEGDLSTTGKVFKYQRRDLQANQRLARVVAVQMRVLKMVILAEYFGMPIDRDVLMRLTKETEARTVIVQKELKACLEAVITHPLAQREFNAGSPKQLSALLYGGRVTYKERVPAGVFKTGKKTGQTRYAIVKHDVAFPPLTTGKSASTDEAALISISVRTNNPAASALAKAILDARSPAKLLSTYYRPIAAAIKVSTDERLHGQFNMATTNTGRKSSSNPNLQNIPDEARAAIKAAPGRIICAADWSQLEVVNAAFLSGCPKLRKIILSGESLHDMVKTMVEKRLGYEVKKTDVKRVVFGRIYGGGAETLAAQSGVPIDTVQEIIDALDRLSPVLAGFWKKVVEPALLAAKKPLRKIDDPGQFWQSMYELPTGRLIHFETPRPGFPPRFAVPEMKNRPIQSIATADYVPFTESLQLEWLAKRPQLLIDGDVMPIAMVHDETVFDVSQGKGESAMRAMFKWLQMEAIKRYNEYFSIDFDLPIALQMGFGDSWLSAKESAAPV